MNGSDQGRGGAPAAIKMQLPAHVTSRYQFSRHCEIVNWQLEGAPPEKRSWTSGNSSGQLPFFISFHHRLTITAAVKRGIFPFTHERVNFICLVVFAFPPHLPLPSSFVLCALFPAASTTSISANRQGFIHHLQLPPVSST